MNTNVISFSGGRTSAYLVYIMRQIDPDCKIVFCDTGAEHPKTYEFIRNIARNWKLDITCLRCKVHMERGVGNTYEVVSLDDIKPDLVPFRNMIRKYSTPYIAGAFCTERMKTVPFKKYCVDNFGKNNYTTWLGIRIDEPKRLHDKKGYCYLAEISDFEKQDILNWWKKQPFDLEIDEYLGNCMFCIKKGINKVALAAKDMPQEAQQFIDMVSSKEVPIKRETPPEIMYRQHHSLESIIKTYEHVSRDELISKLRNTRQYDTGSCSESCEAIQIDMFKEI